MQNKLRAYSTRTVDEAFIFVLSALEEIGVFRENVQREYGACYVSTNEGLEMMIEFLESDDLVVIDIYSKSAVDVVDFYNEIIKKVI